MTEEKLKAAEFEASGSWSESRRSAKRTRNTRGPTPGNTGQFAAPPWT